jgi:hypothetical protein
VAPQIKRSAAAPAAIGSRGAAACDAGAAGARGELRLGSPGGSTEREEEAAAMGVFLVGGEKGWRKE